MDAVSLATGALSLAITVCDGLISYYQAWSVRDTEVQETLDRLTALKETTTRFVQPLSKLAAKGVSHTDHILGLVLQLDAGSTRLQDVFRKCQDHGTPNQGTRAITAAMRGLMYPFKRKTLKELEEAVMELRANLASASDLLQLDIGCHVLVNGDLALDGIKDIKESQEESKIATHDLKDMALRSNALAIQMNTEVGEIQNGIHQATDAICSVEQQMIAISASMSKMSLGIDQKFDELFGSGAEQTEIHSQILLQLSQLVQHIQVHNELRGQDVNTSIGPQMMLHLMSKPRLLRDVCDRTISQKKEESSISTTTMRQAALPSLSKPLCSCQRRIRRRTHKVGFGGIALFRTIENELRHLEECSFSTLNRQDVFYGLRVDGVKWFLGKTIEAAFKWRTGAGGSAITTMLNIRKIYRPNSPALQLVRDIATKSAYLCERKSYHIRFDRLLVRLLQLYSSGAASPYDVDQHYGENVLHLFIRCFNVGQPGVQQLVAGLVEAQVPLAETGTGSCGWTPLGYLVRDYNHNSVCSRDELALIEAVIRLGAASLGSNYFVSKRAYCTPLVASFMDDIDELQVGPIGRAVVLHDETSLAFELMRCPQGLQDEHRPLGQNALHLAAGWLAGLNLLLDHGAGPLIVQPDDRGRSPLSYAVDAGQVDAVCSFLDTLRRQPCPRWELLCNIVRNCRPACEFSLFAAAVSAVVQAMATELEAFRIFAQSSLPSDSWALLALPTDRLLDGYAVVVHQTLLDAGVWLLDRFDLAAHPGIYHVMAPNQSISFVAEDLWELGFRDVSVMDDKSGFTPVVSACLEGNLMFVQWLLSKHALFQPPVPPLYQDLFDPTITLSHYIAFALLTYLRKAWYNGYSVDNVPFPQLLQSILTDRSTDCCHCPCSLRGCTPALIFLKYLKLHYNPFCPLPYKDSFQLIFGDLFDTPEVIRFATFDVLGMTHTCCSELAYNPPPGIHLRIDISDADEIRRRQKCTTAQLDCLLLEFSNQYNTVSGNLRVFFTTYWRDRMIQVLDEASQIDGYHLEKGRRLATVGCVPPPQNTDEEDSGQFSLNEFFEEIAVEEGDYNYYQAVNRTAAELNAKELDLKTPFNKVNYWIGIAIEKNLSQREWVYCGW